jgi:excisionase family DNA binding protein
MTGRALLSVDQACHQLGGISRSMLYNLINSGDLERVKVGNRAFIPQSSIDKFVAGLREV